MEGFSSGSGAVEGAEGGDGSIEGVGAVGGEDVGAVRDILIDFGV